MDALRRDALTQCVVGKLYPSTAEFDKEEKSESRPRKLRLKAVCAPEPVAEKPVWQKMVEEELNPVHYEIDVRQPSPHSIIGPSRPAAWRHEECKPQTERNRKRKLKKKRHQARIREVLHKESQKKAAVFSYNTQLRAVVTVSDDDGRKEQGVSKEQSTSQGIAPVTTKNVIEFLSSIVSVYTCEAVSKRLNPAFVEASVKQFMEALPSSSKKVLCLASDLKVELCGGRCTDTVGELSNSIEDTLMEENSSIPHLKESLITLSDWWIRTCSAK